VKKKKKKKAIAEDHTTEPNRVEAITALRAVHLCHELGFYKVILKGDALQVV
jgi:hypothetical protein